ncbi:MAG: phosphatidylserine decarboxylase family protein [Epsilonproteobacteria bacterium]|nr:phosphatidylserine decarboxylase family protein [Campylobacterota bacterium]
MKKTEFILTEGYVFIGVTGILFLISILFRFDTLWQLAYFVLFGFMVYFFINPERIPDEKGDDVIISPADGEIIEITQTKEVFFTNTEMVKISIRLSLLDNHIQRSPIEGILKQTQYLHGEFLALSSDKASELNEQNRTLFENNKLTVITNQIAGFLTRRIVTWQTEGEIDLAQRYGMIMFGSQVDVYIPTEAKLKVIVGEKVKAGESLIAMV